MKQQVVHRDLKTHRQRIWISVIALISLEQIIKLIINSFYFNKEIPIIPNAVYFKPMFNRDYSWFNSMLQLGVGKWLHIAIVAVLILLIYKFYSYLVDRSLNDNAINWIYIMLISGAMCSLIDKAFWNGSLDYIALKGLFTFDLKDVYVNTSIGLLLFFTILGNKALKQIFEDKTVLNGFYQYVLHGAKYKKL